MRFFSKLRRKKEKIRYRNLRNRKLRCLSSQLAHSLGGTLSAADYQRPHYAPGVPAVVALPTQPLSTVLDDAAKRSRSGSRWIF